MSYERDIPYLYGKLNKELEKSTYSGSTTETAETVVDNAEMTIRVNVKNIDSLITQFLQNPENTFIIDGR